VKRKVIIAMMAVLVTAIAGLGADKKKNEGLKSERGIRRDFQALRSMIQDISSSCPAGFPGMQISGELKGLEREYEQLEGRPEADRDVFMRKYAEFSTKAALANPLVRKSPIMFVVRRQYPPDHHNTETMFAIRRCILTGTRSSSPCGRTWTTTTIFMK